MLLKLEDNRRPFYKTDCIQVERIINNKSQLGIFLKILQLYSQWFI